MNKNWNDRADKDLFFTILSVKNIGVISGAEWTTIGNHMRSMGYGFTNEGCRQHFQGLRRAQHKAESTGGGVLDDQHKADPTANPITRRPGPGRGRPRKQVSGPVGPAPSFQSAGNSTANDLQHSEDGATPTTASAIPHHDPTSARKPDSIEIDQTNEEQPLKRQRIEVDEEEQVENDDEAVLALAADGITGAVDAYGAPDYYGEA
ncbi:hypothetical protein F5Y16DRAFT_316313 [Xylariaceae sp. FL0255]|nr:hypothetical protein F5Y16DRAFT_316313 [Xylariaceae sp. FL0255]